MEKFLRVFQPHLLVAFDCAKLFGCKNCCTMGPGWFDATCMKQ